MKKEQKNVTPQRKFNSHYVAKREKCNFTIKKTTLLNGEDHRSKLFLQNIRIYNIMFSFTSIGGKIDASMNNGSAPPQFIPDGHNYHLIGNLLQQDGSKPKFAQLYIYDTENEMSNKMKHFKLVNMSFMLLKLYKYIC